MKRNKLNKGFTLVELLVVIAILAILATVSIVGYSSFTKKAEYSNDVSLVTQWNTLLDGKDILTKANSKEKLNNVNEVKEYFKENGSNDDDFIPQSDGYHFYWRETDNNVYLVEDADTSNNQFDVSYPEDNTNITKDNSYRLDLEYCLLTSNVEGYTFSKNVLIVNQENTVSIKGTPSLTKVTIGSTDYTVTDNTFKITPINNDELTISGGTAKQDATVTAPSAKTGLTYDGTSQSLINAGEVVGSCQWQYSLNNNSSYSTTVPSATNAGTYTVYYKLVGDNTYNDIAEESVQVTIAKKNATITTTGVTKVYTYTGSEQTINSGATVDSGATLTYINNAFTERPSTGKQTITISAAETTNYNVASTTVEITVNKATQTAPAALSKDNATVTSTTVTLQAISAGHGATKYGYSIENDASKVSNWQTELTFEGLTPNTTYYFFAKYAGNTNYNEAVSAGKEIKTKASSFTITNSLTNASADSGNATAINPDGSVTLIYTPTGDYSLPTSKDNITVAGATIVSWTPTNKSGKNTNAELVINNPTDDISITIVAGLTPQVTKNWTGDPPNGTNNVDISVTATGEGLLSYQWEYNFNPSNSEWNEIENETTNAYKNDNLQGTLITTGFDVWIRCKVEGKYGYTYSEIWHVCTD